MEAHFVDMEIRGFRRQNKRERWEYRGGGGGFCLSVFLSMVHTEDGHERFDKGRGVVDQLRDVIINGYGWGRQDRGGGGEHSEQSS